MESIFDSATFTGGFFTVLYHVWWIVLPPFLYIIFKEIWSDFVLAYSADAYMSKWKWTMLEIIPPRDLEKGPKPFESIYAGLSGVMASPNTFDKWIKGTLTQPRFSLELVSEEGKVHYYIRTFKEFGNLVKAQIYAHYPDAEVLEVEDYYQKFPKIVPNRDWDLWGTDFQFVDSKMSPYYPMRTYDKFQEDFTGEMIDPMASVVETMGNLGPGQHLWLQMVLSPIPEPDTVKAGKELINAMTGREVKKKLTHKDHLMDVLSNLTNIFRGKPLEFKSEAKKDDSALSLDQRLTPVERDIYKAVQENIARNNYKTKMRMILIGHRDGFDKSNVSAFIGALKQFNDFNMNQIKPEDISKTYGKIFFTKGIAAMRKRKIYDRYRRRNMDGANLILSTKELATIFHFPTITVKSPAITQTSSKWGAAPANLPIEE